MFPREAIQGIHDLGLTLIFLFIQWAQVLYEVDAVYLALLVDHVVAFELLGFALLLVVLEVADLLLQLIVMEVLRVPVRDLVELEQVTELHFLLSVLLLLAA